MDLKIAGKRALVMGGSTGIGKSIARTLIQEGVQVAVCARNEERLIRAATEIGAKSAIPCDLSRPGAASQLTKAALESLGGLDIVVINTGGPPKGDFAEITNEQWQSSFQGLWMSAVESIQTALPSMKNNRWGRIMVVTSVAAKEAMPHLTISNGLRAGLLGLVKSLSHEVAQDGITVNVLLPGYTRTERLKELGIAEEKMTSQIPARRLAEPEELAALAAFLASDHAGYITGQAISCDGGYMKGF